MMPRGGSFNPDSTLDGTYKIVGEHMGWPHLQNKHGMYCYRFQTVDQKRWFLDCEFTPKASTRISCIEASEGTIPTGTNEWFCRVDGVWKFRDVSVSLC